MSIRILLVDDHAVVRQGIRRLLDDHPDMEVIGEAADGIAAVRLAREQPPDVVLVHSPLPGLDSSETTRQIVHHSPDTRVLALSHPSEDGRMGEMFDAGASGSLLYNFTIDMLTTAIRNLSRNKVVGNAPPRTTGVDGDGPMVESTPIPLLSRREREVLEALAGGKSSKQIASSLHLSVRTVESHRRNIMEKLDIHNIAGLTKYALRQGITYL